MDDVDAIGDCAHECRAVGRIVIGDAFDEERGTRFDPQLLREGRPRVAGHQNASRTCATSLATAWIASRMTSRSFPPPILKLPRERRACVTGARPLPLFASMMSTATLVAAEPAPNPPK